MATASTADREETEPTVAPVRPSRIAHLPFSLFSAPMGIGGLGLAWREATAYFGVPAFPGEALLAVAALVWALLTLLHIWREIRNPRALFADLSHPARAAFAGAFTIGLMMVSAMLIPTQPDIAFWTWTVAVILHLMLALLTVRGLMLTPRNDPMSLMPPTLIPLVGMLLAPVFGVRLGVVMPSWLLFGIGVIFWLTVQPLLFQRIAAGPAFPEKLKPTLVIFLAPPSVAFLSLVALQGRVEWPALALFGYAAFLAVVFLTILPRFLKAPLALSWWSYTFPAAAFTVALFTLVRAYPFPFADYLLWAQLTIASLLLVVVMLATLLGLANGKLLVSG
jgi:tellurite resistance protein